MSIQLVSFDELNISLNEDIPARIEKHSAQSGAIFRPRGEALKQVKLTEDHVKYTKGKIEMDALVKGYIPHPTDPAGSIKITVNAMKAYVESHPDVKSARIAEAEAAMDLDNARALANCYLDVKDHLKMLQSARINEWHSDATVKANDQVRSGGTLDIN